ncbi:MAG: penicillin acylase family protein, partial [Candidatus Eremiobacteraeota bacterium]|nr:penicillin acylase family protein [Candidatus Eremiobacteraeota bacterium]
ERHQLPIEFRLLGYRPELWTPTDSIAIIKLMAQRLDDQWTQIELRSLLQKKMDPNAANALMDAQVPQLEHFIPTGMPQRAAKRPRTLPFDIAQTDAVRVWSPLPPEEQNGSNNWTVAGNRVTTGKPVVSNDTHLEHAVPSTYWLVHLKGGGIDVEGFIIPGIPFVALGHNERIAFGVTSGDAAVEDLFVERFRSPTSDEYRADGSWVRAEHRMERIAIKGSAASPLDVLVTRHGPVLARHGTKANALAWPILRGGNEVELLRRLDRAGNWLQFQDGLAQVVGPIFNWVYADVDGNIGYHLAGKVPRRAHGDGSVPVEGEDEQYAWRGYIPFGELPHTYDPQSGFVATANNQLAPSNTEIGSSSFFDAPYRVHEIVRRLGASAPMSPQAIGSIQADVYDLPRHELASTTARILAASRIPRLHLIGSQLGAWDGNVTANETAATFVMVEVRMLENMLITPKMGAELRPRYDKDFNALVPFDRVLHYGDSSLASIGVTKAAIIAAIPAACTRAADSLGVDGQRGLASISPWGTANQAIFHHPMGRAWPLTEIFNIKNFDQPGDGFTVYAAKPDHGPASRFVDDLSNWDNSSLVLTLGESGQFNSPHYQDEVEDFAAVRWVPLPFSDAAVKAATKDTLTLTP